MRLSSLPEIAHNTQLREFFPSPSPFSIAAYPLVNSTYPHLLRVTAVSWARVVGAGQKKTYYPFPLYSLLTMNSEASSIKNFGAAGFLFDRESPFSPFYFKEDALASKSQTHLLSSASFSSSTSHLRSEHRYCLTKGKGKGNDRPWLTLFVSSRSPKPKLLPLFIGNDSISGTVDLNLEKPETIREVKVTVCVVFPLHHCNRLTAKLAQGRDDSFHPRIAYLS